MRAHVRWLESGFVQAVHGFFGDARVHERLLSRRDGQRRLTDALHVIELLHVEATREHLGPLALVRRLEGLCLDLDMPSSLAAESAQLRLESDEHAVRVTTVHRSKGLQYPIVYCPHLWHAWSPTVSTAVRFHDRDHVALIDVLSPEFEEHKERAEEEDSAEALRLVYVALTRAKHRCSVVWGGFSRCEKTALGRLLGVGDGSDDGLRAALSAWRERSDGAIGWRALPPVDDRVYRHADDAPAFLAARKLDRALPLGERLTSFSRIAKHAPRDNAELIAEGLDRDAVPAEEAPPVAQVSRAKAMDEPRVTLADFPAGPSAGTLVHAIFENIDFQRSDPDELSRQTRLALAQGQLDVDLYRETLAHGIAEVLDTPLPLGSATFALASLERKARVDELEFMLEIERGSAFSPANVADVLTRHGAPADAPDYPARVRALGHGAVNGFLRGFIDLVFRHGERFYVIDYKSNHLGEHAVDYEQASLRAAMIDHHYYLQAYLYTVALHRYLSARLPGYDYDQHVGGYGYLFLRGMSKAHASGTGVLAERPSRAVIEELSGLLRGGRT
jgi:exodeoxyribonuclease V beta subunit